VSEEECREACHSPADREEEIQSLKAELEAARREARENWDRFLRAVADNENYRRRVERDLVLSIRRGKYEFLRGCLELKDHLELALRAPGDEGSLRQGLELILRQFEALFEKEGLVPIAAAGVPFDPAVHEAVAVEEDNAVAEPVVREELRRGYRFGEEVLRPARVKVARPPEPCTHDELA